MGTLKDAIAGLERDKTTIRQQVRGHILDKQRGRAERCGLRNSASKLAGFEIDSHTSTRGARQSVLLTFEYRATSFAAGGG